MDELIQELLDMDLINDDDIVNFTDDSKELIHIISEQCKNTAIYNTQADKINMYGNEMTAEELYIDLLVKIVNAPTSIHVMACTRILIPLIDSKLN
jgi:hypothetical protein